jgi:hypothetical protein
LIAKESYSRQITFVNQKVEMISVKGLKSHLGRIEMVLSWAIRAGEAGEKVVIGAEKRTSGAPGAKQVAEKICFVSGHDFSRA